MRLAYEMEYKHPTNERSDIEMTPFSAEYQNEYRTIYNRCFHEMREALDIRSYDFIQDDSYFDSGMDVVYLLVEKGSLVGAVSLEDDEINDLFVDPRYQDLGYGRKILLWALENIHTERVILHVSAWNEKAVKLYRRIGFEITKTIIVDQDESGRKEYSKDLSMINEIAKNWLDERGFGDRLTEHTETIDTVEHAAIQVGCTEAEIAKTLSFIVDEKPVIIVMAGDGRVNSSKFKAHFHTKPSMIPRDKVEEMTGFLPGGVCPFGVPEGIPVWLDVSMKRFDYVHPAGGNEFVSVKLTPDELEKASGAIGWCDVCKGWEE